MSSSRTDSSSQERNLVLAIQQRCNESVILELVNPANVNITDESGETALFYAIQSNYKNVVGALIDAGADVNVSDNNGNTALLYAIRSSGYENAIPALIAAGADVNRTYGYNGKTPLIYAVHKNNESVVQALIDSGADVNITDKSGKTALFHAVEKRNSESVVQVLIKAGAHVNMIDNDGKTALFYAVQQVNKKRVVQALIDAGADINITDKDGKTALFYALEQRNSDSLVQVLIEAGADVNITDKIGKTALNYAVRLEHDCESLALSLIAAGADVNFSSTNNYRPLFSVVQRSDDESLVRSLIKAGAKVNQPVYESSTALFFAVSQSSNESMVHTLIDAGADVNIANDDGQTALFNAVREGNNEGIIHTLIDAGAEVNLVDKDGETPFSYALTTRYSGYESTVLTLIARGANVNISKEGKTALLWAIQQRYKESVVRAMIEAGAKADVNKTDSNNKTPLYYAFGNRNNGVISALIDAGADVNLTYNGSETVLFYAVQQYNNEDVVRKLVVAGADVSLTYHDGKTVLFYAVQYYYSDSVIKMLISAGADIKKSDNNGQTILFYVGHSDTSDQKMGTKARVLIALGAEVNKRDRLGKTVLLCAAQSNNENLVRALIDAGADVHVTDSDDKTALFYAIQQSDNENMVLALIDAGAEVNKLDKYGYSALFYAVQERKKIKNEKVVKALVAANADINIILNDGKTALFYAAQQENNEMVVQALIEAGADASITDKYGKTALFYAVQKSWDNTEGVVRALIEANKDILTVKDIYGRTALFYINLTSPKTTNYLLQEESIGCLRLKDNCHVNILTFAVENCISQTGSYDTIRDGVLQKLTKQGIIKRESFAKAIMNIIFRMYISNVQYRSDYNFRKFEQLSRLYKENVDNNVWERTNKMESFMAVMKEDFPEPSKALELLVELGADPDCADSDGNTALHLTARSPLLGASEETVMNLCKHLKKFEVLFNARNHQHQTPLLFCISQKTGNTELQSAMKTVVNVCRFLVKNGSSIEETSRKGEAVFHFMIKLFLVSLKLHDKTKRQEVLNDVNELLQLFLLEEAAKVAVNKSDVDLNSPLHLWASLALPSPQDYANDHTFQSLLKVILNSLLKCGARVNARNQNDETPLHLCKTWFAVKMLIEAGANVNDVDLSRRTALLVAAKNQLFLENPDCFYPDVSEEPRSFWKNALEIGLDPFETDKEDESVLGILVASENFILAKSLVDVACEENYIQSEKETISLLNAICKDRSTRTHWKAGLVQDILKPTRKISAAIALRFCCENEMEVSVPNVQEQDKAVPMEVNDGEGDDDDEQPRPKRRRVDQNELDEKGEALDPDTIISVHLEIIKILRWFGAADDETCKEAAEKYPQLKRFLMGKVNTDEIPKLIPWTSVSKRYEEKLAKVSRRQEYQEIDQYWYHKDHVGSGSFGHIFVGINGKDGREVALKRIETLRMQRPEDKREIKSLTDLAYCEQVVRYVQCFDNENFSFIVLELMEGNLEEYLTDVLIFEAKKSVELCQDVDKGLRYLHENDILHRDLKPQNILYKTHPKLCLKIADFGLSRRMDSISTTVYGTNAGTRCWIAPEVLKGSKDLSKASDMFSCGLLLHYILSVKKHPFSPADCVNKSEAQVAHETEANIMTNTMEGWDNSLSPEATHLIKLMLKHDEKKRATAGEASDHPFCYSRKKKIDFLIAVANQLEFACSWKSHPLTTDFEKMAGTIFNGNWNDPKYLHMPAINAEMTKKFRGYRTFSAVDLVRFIRNSYAHVSEVTRPTPIRKMLLEDFVFLEYFPNLVMEVYKAVTIHGWDQSRDEIKYVMKNQ